MSNSIYKSGRLSLRLRYFEYVNTLLGSLLSRNIENQQITSAKYTVLMLRVRQNEPRVILTAKIVGCSHVIASSLVRRFGQTGISIDAQD